MSRQELPSNFTPVNALEESLVLAQRGEVPIDAFIQQMLETDLFVVTSEVALEGKMSFLQLRHNGETFAATFTSLDRVAKFAEASPYCLSVPAKKLIPLIPAGMGIVLNPGWAVGFELPVFGMIRKDYSLKRSTDDPGGVH